MTDNNYQYNSCTSRGACSTNPRTSSLQEILILYLKTSAYYALFLEENNIHNVNIKNLILNTISIMITNPEFSEKDFLGITASFEKELPVLIKDFEKICKQNDTIKKPLKHKFITKKNNDIVSSIRFGEKEFLKNIKSVPIEISNLYKIMFIIAKSICLNILNLQTYGLEEKSGYITILKLLNLINEEEKNSDTLIKFIKQIVRLNNELMRTIRTVQTERYGNQCPKKVSYSTTKGKAILVVGANIRELEQLLESVKDTDIDVYTHDKMILAHTFPKFSEYKNLKGQFGQSIDNYLPDFATFPGPILLTRHSLFNVDNLYRGQLFTTDIANTKGIIQIKNNDFSKIIASAQNSKGFKTGKICNEEIIGFDFEKLKEDIKSKLGSNKYSKIFILGNSIDLPDISEYFDTIIKKSSEDTLLISLALREGRNDMLSINACFDVFAIIKIMEFINYESDMPITIFMPECRRHSISILIYLKTVFNAEIFAGKCNPISFNPVLMNTLENSFGIKIITNALADIERINKEK